MKIDQIIQKLDSVKKSGQGYRSRCPVHGSKGQTLSVTEKDGGYIVAHCFSCGAGGVELVEALGLPISILFPEDNYIPPTITKAMRSENIFDGIVLEMAEQADSLDDRRTVNKSRERAKGFKVKAEEALISFIYPNHPALKPFETIFNTAIQESPALRDEIVNNFWDGIAERYRMSLKTM